MKSIIRNAVTIAAATLLSGVGSAYAGESNVLEATVPFPFVVNGQTMPAGKYLVQHDDLSPDILVVRGEGANRSTAVVGTMPEDGRDPAGAQPAMTFTRYENGYRLAGVWEGTDHGWDVTRR